MESVDAISQDIIYAMLQQAYPNKKVAWYESISSGCANINIKVVFKEHNDTILLRVYLREPESSYREQKISSLVKDKLQVPSIDYIGIVEGYTFACCKYISGITLRELLLSNANLDINKLMHKVGTLQATIASFSFPQAGFFNRDLAVVDPFANNELLLFKDKVLDYLRISNKLTELQLQKLHEYFTKYQDLLPSEKPANLVHGDFGPENILVSTDNNKIEISGIIDWEFSFAGSILHDMANMLRYAANMPQEFQTGFLEGTREFGVILDDNWQIKIDLLNMISMLDCLQRTDSQKQPNRYRDIIKLVDLTLLPF